MPNLICEIRNDWNCSSCVKSVIVSNIIWGRINLIIIAIIVKLNCDINCGVVKRVVSLKRHDLKCHIRSYQGVVVRLHNKLHRVVIKSEIHAIEDLTIWIISYMSQVATIYIFDYWDSWCDIECLNLSVHYISKSLINYLRYVNRTRIEDFYIEWYISWSSIL